MLNQMRQWFRYHTHNFGIFLEQRQKELGGGARHDRLSYSGRDFSEHGIRPGNG